MKAGRLLVICALIVAATAVIAVAARSQGTYEVTAVFEDTRGLIEAARHRMVGPGDASIFDDHYPDHPTGPLDRKPKATNPSEAAFLEIGAGAAAWLIEAAAVGARHIEARMANAVALTKIAPPAAVDEALGTAAIAGRFAAGDLESILETRPGPPARPPGPHTLQPGTAAWEGFGQ